MTVVMDVAVLQCRCQRSFRFSRAIVDVFVTDDWFAGDDGC